MFNVGARIRDIRKQNNITLQQLSEKIGLTQPQLSRIENNQNMAQIDTLFNLCNIFNITLSDFFSPDGNAEPLYPELKALLDSARNLSPKQLLMLSEFLKSMK